MAYKTFHNHVLFIIIKLFISQLSLCYLRRIWLNIFYLDLFEKNSLKIVVCWKIVKVISYLCNGSIYYLHFSFVYLLLSIWLQFLYLYLQVDCLLFPNVYSYHRLYTSICLLIGLFVYIFGSFVQCFKLRSSIVCTQWRTRTTYVHNPVTMQKHTFVYRLQERSRKVSTRT